MSGGVIDVVVGLTDRVQVRERLERWPPGQEVVGTLLIGDDGGASVEIACATSDNALRLATAAEQPYERMVAAERRQDELPTADDVLGILKPDCTPPERQP